MPIDSDAANNSNLIWIDTGSLDADLDAATWLEPTRKLRQSGWDVTLIHAGEPQLTNIGDVAVTSISMPDVYLLRQAIFHWHVLREIFRRWRTTDVILFHQMSAPWLLPLRFLRPVLGKKTPLIIMDTRTAHMTPKEMASWRDRVLIFYYESINRIANHLADGQTAITTRMAQMMRIPDKQLIGIWPSGVNLDLFAAAQENHDWELAFDEVHLIYIGALHHPRNLMNLCQAVIAANQKRPRFVFTLVGDGTERAELQALASSTDGCIRVLPPVPHEQVPEILAAAHVGALPFPDQEQFRVSSPIKLFEYMASGIPILATHIVCHTDVVKDGKYAFWAQAGSVECLEAALEEVWNQRYHIQEKGQEAAVAAQGWSWAASARKLDSALRNGLTRKLK